MKHAMMKYMEQTGHGWIQRDAKGFSYGKDRSRWWWLVLNHWEKVIKAKTNGNKWVCSKEKLDAVDFRILDQYKCTKEGLIKS